MTSRIEAHPDAAIFPMMSADELADLAADIKENGQRFPIVIGPYEGREVIVDGRNRYEACEIAGVEPKFEKLNGHDAKAFILSVNVNRRHMTGGQRAMAVAMLYPETSKLKRKGEGSLATKLLNGDKTSLSQARTVLRDARALAEQVMSGAISLDAAYAEVKAAAAATKSAAATFTRLRTEAPDLADLVTEDRLQLREAITALDSRIAEARRAQETATRVLQTVFNAIFPRGAEPGDWAERLTKDVSPEFWSGADVLNYANLNACAEVMEYIATRFRTTEEAENGSH